MDRWIFNSDHEAFRDSARKFFRREVSPHVETWREAGIVDRSAFQKAGAQGLLLMWADEAYGGLGLTDFRYEQILIEENVRHGDINFYMTLHSRLVAPYLGHLGTEEQKQRLLPACVAGEAILAIAMTEPSAGSDLAGMKTVAVDQGDHWLLNGSKIYISNGINADLVIVAARTGPGAHDIGLFIVERGMAGFERGRKLKKMGLQSQDTAELFFADVRVPKANLLGDPLKGFRALMRFLPEERLIAACISLASAQTAFDLTLDYVRNRRAFGQRIGDFQNIRFRLADMRTQLDIAQVYVDRCVEEHDAGRLSPEDAARAKLHTSELEGRVVDEGVQMHGGAGFMDEFRISRMYTDARVSRILAGSSEIMREIIARSIGLDPRKSA